MHLHACQVRNKAVNSRPKYATGLCCCTCAVFVVLVQSLLYLCSLCCTCVAYFGREVTPLFVDSARALWPPFCFRFVVQLSQTIILRNCHCGARVRAGGVGRTQSAWFIDERGGQSTLRALAFFHVSMHSGHHVQLVG